MSPTATVPPPAAPPLPASSLRYLPASINPSSHQSPAWRGPCLPCQLVASSPLKDRARGWRGRHQGGLPTGSADPHVRLGGGGGDASPSLASLLQSHLEGGIDDATWSGDDADAIRFTLVPFYFFLHTN
jgi:hypothetical protein